MTDVESLFRYLLKAHFKEVASDCLDKLKWEFGKKLEELADKCIQDILNDFDEALKMTKEGDKIIFEFIRNLKK